MLPIDYATAAAVIQKIAPAVQPHAELEHLCDSYVLERDSKNQYHIAYPSAIGHCKLFGLM